MGAEISNISSHRPIIEQVLCTREHQQAAKPALPRGDFSILSLPRPPHPHPSSSTSNRINLMMACSFSIYEDDKERERSREEGSPHAVGREGYCRLAGT
jgi:hypothetical protein